MVLGGVQGVPRHAERGCLTTCARCRSIRATKKKGLEMAKVMIYVACWKCGRQMKIDQDAYYNGLVCGGC